MVIFLRAKILMLSSSAKDECNAQWAEQILTDVSAAFQHSFSIFQGKIGEKAMEAYGNPLPDKTVQDSQTCQAIFACDGESQGVSLLYDELDLPLRVRSFTVPEALCGRNEKPVSLYVATVLSLDEDTLRRAMKIAFLMAQEQDIRLCHIPPTGETREEWEAAVRVQEAACPSQSAAGLSAVQAIREIIQRPERMGFLICPPYAGSIMTSAAQALCAHPGVIHDTAWDEDAGVFSALLSPDGEEPSPISSALTVAQLLRYSLKLQREAACVEAAVKNVIASGWRAKEEGQAQDGAISADGMLQLICEQITVAGELMRRSSL